MWERHRIIYIIFIIDTKIQGTSLEKCGNQIGHDDEDLFKERLKNMGKGIFGNCILLYNKCKNYRIYILLLLF